MAAIITSTAPAMKMQSLASFSASCLVIGAPDCYILQIVSRRHAVTIRGNPRVLVHSWCRSKTTSNKVSPRWALHISAPLCPSLATLPKLEPGTFYCPLSHPGACRHANAYAPQRRASTGVLRMHNLHQRLRREPRGSSEIMTVSRFSPGPASANLTRSVSKSACVDDGSGIGYGSVSRC
jgi:hypothetical protein